jgi:hypothetical protein
MTQQVVLCRYKIPTINPALDDVSVDFVLEATGSDTNLDFTTSETPGTAIDTFWNGLSGAQVAKVSSYISDQYSRSTNACTLEWYDITAHLDGSAPGAPFRIDHGTLGGGELTNSYVPPACCAVLAYRRAYGTDQEHSGATRPRARDRGRIHIGPLTQAAGVYNAGYIFTGAVFDFVEAGKGLAQTKNAISANQFNWVQWSRVNASVAPIAFVGMQAGPGYLRGRADESATRVLNWESV